MDGSKVLAQLTTFASCRWCQKKSAPKQLIAMTSHLSSILNSTKANSVRKAARAIPTQKWNQRKELEGTAMNELSSTLNLLRM
jgi:hypothetical protein